MPGVSADADEAIIVEWAVAIGASVKSGDPLATIETDKAIVDLEAEVDGVLFRTFATAGQTVAVGVPIAVLLAEGEQVEDESAFLAGLGLTAGSTSPTSPTSPESVEAAPSVVASPEQAPSGAAAPAAASASPGRVFATPLVRRMAAEAGVPLVGITGTGPDGRIRRRDLEAVLAGRSSTAAAPGAASGTGAEGVPAVSARVAASPRASAYTDIPVSKFRRAVAHALTASKQNVPHFYLKASCRVDELLALRASLNGDGATKVTINDFFVKAAAGAMQRVPEMNVVWTGEATRRFESVDIAVAMATERGLMTPVVRAVEARSLSDVSASVKDLASRAAAGTLKQHELEGGSLSISNLGMFGVTEFSAIINPPQVGILAVGAVVPQPVVGPSGALEIGQVVTVVLSVDHRPVDGVLAAQWLQHFKSLVENPVRILA
jgi:pyruvate dehydrogenase E2 component (dihydrolipoamide acetyltransferase)